jgi:hypothetical protein
MRAGSWYLACEERADVDVARKVRKAPVEVLPRAEVETAEMAGLQHLAQPDGVCNRNDDDFCEQMSAVCQAISADNRQPGRSAPLARTCAPAAAACGAARTRRACLRQRHHVCIHLLLHMRGGAWKLVGVQRGLDVDASGGVRVAVGEDVEGALGADAGEGQGVGGVGRHLSETNTRCELR